MKTLVMTVMALMVATVGIAGDYGVQFSCVVEGNGEGLHVKAIHNGTNELKCKAMVKTFPTEDTFWMPEGGGWAYLHPKEKKEVLQSIDSKYGIAPKISECRVIKEDCELN